MDTFTSRRAFLAAAGGIAALPFAARANDMPFEDWLRGFREEAMQKGMKRGSLDQALTGISPIARVLELDRSQPEVRLTFEQYFARVVNKARIDTGRTRLAENRELLGRVAQRYPVQARFIVALWAVETDFGRLTGGFNIFAALATLAYDGRRSQFFREELLNAIRIVDRGLIKASDMRGSWAGAMGQSQFMPSSYLAYAVDFDGDGKADIWGSRADVFASIANYLVRVGWKDDETWGRAATLPPGFDRTLVDHNKVTKPLSEWQALGVRAADGGALPSRDIAASIVQPDGEAGRAFLVYGNFRVIMRWNRSVNFATSVGLLADSIGEV
ncbi:MAG: lytic murein transglycosylase [Rhodospirillales bacterium]|nr:lytic murein transglycosylase [Rhodospirillales bacterium]